MLKLGEELFTVGRSTFYDSLPESGEKTAKIYVRVRLQASDIEYVAQMDTGAVWSILDHGTAREIGVLDQQGEEAAIKTAIGTIKGRLTPVITRFVADEGVTLEVEGTFLVSPEWPAGRLFLGYCGLLDRIRFAADPQANHFYFGPSGPTE